MTKKKNEEELIFEWSWLGFRWQACKFSCQLWWHMESVPWTPSHIQKDIIERLRKIQSKNCILKIGGHASQWIVEVEDYLRNFKLEKP